MSSYEADLWRKYLVQYGLASDNIELGAGLVCSTIANFAGKISKREFTASDFMPSQYKKDDHTPEAQASVAHKLRMFFAAKMRTQKTATPRKPT